MNSFVHRMPAAAGSLGILAALAILLPAWAPLLAADRVTLKNGFSLLCDHERAAGGKVRLFTGPGDDSYLELEAGQILSTIHVPDPPASVRPAQSASTTALPKEEKLTPAELHELLERAGARHNLDVDLLASVIQAESGGDAHAVSRAGARGLMQLMPGTADRLGVDDSFRPAENVDGGTRYLDRLLTRYHDNLALALAAYNAGPAAVDRYRGVPPYRETRRYVARVIREFNRRKRASVTSRKGDLVAAAHLH